VRDLLERLLAGLAGLPDDQVDQLVPVVQDEIVVAQQDRGPVCWVFRAVRIAAATSSGLDTGRSAIG
jgi:hypothetical protein